MPAGPFCPQQWRRVIWLTDRDVKSSAEDAAAAAAAVKRDKKEDLGQWAEALARGGESWDSS